MAKCGDRFASAKIRRAFDYVKDPNMASAYASLRATFSNYEVDQLMRAMGFGFPERTSDLLSSPTRFEDLSNQISYFELTHYMSNQLLRDSDVMSMAHGLELRVPFVDQVLFDSVSKIPSKIRTQANKKLLTDAMAGLPDEVVNRPKQGFRFPFDEWFKDHWLETELQFDLPSTLRLQPWYRRWSLVVLQRWLDINF
jgi:asparagine synthase (glutamine-hydrolysing)